MKKEHVFKIVTILIVGIVLVMAILVLTLDKLDNSYVFTTKIEENIPIEPINEEQPINEESVVEEEKIKPVEEKKPVKEKVPSTQTKPSNKVVEESNEEVISDPEPLPKTLKEQNDDLIKEIYNTYGYRVSYNDESFYYGGGILQFI